VTLQISFILIPGGGAFFDKNSKDICLRFLKLFPIDLKANDKRKPIAEEFFKENLYNFQFFLILQKSLFKNIV